MALEKVRQIIDEFIDDMDDQIYQQYMREHCDGMLADKGSDVAYYLYANNILNLADPAGTYPASFDAYGPSAWEAVFLWKNSTSDEFQKRIVNVLNKLWSEQGSVDADTQELVALIRMDLVESFKTLDWYLSN